MTNPQTYNSFRHQEKPNYAHRFGYNGMEKDDEIKGLGTSYDYGARFLDPRVGRWLSKDPKPTTYESFYAGMGNNTIINTDVKGDYIEGINGKKVKYFIKDGIIKWKNSTSFIKKNGE